MNQRNIGIDHCYTENNTSSKEVEEVDDSGIESPNYAMPLCTSTPNPVVINILLIILYVAPLTFNLMKNEI